MSDRDGSGWRNPFHLVLFILLGAFALLFAGVVFVAVCTAVQSQ